MIKAVINVEAPMQRVFHILTDFPNYKSWIPGCEKCVVTAQNGSVTDTELLINNMKRMEFALRFEAHPPQTITFRMTRGKDLKTYAGTYRLMDAADGKGTVLIAELDVDVGMMPRFMVDKMGAKMLDDLGKSIRIRAAALQGQAATTAAAAPAKAPETRLRRTKRILRVTGSASGYQVYLLGETFTVESRKTKPE